MIGLLHFNLINPAIFPHSINGLLYTEVELYLTLT